MKSKIFCSNYNKEQARQTLWMLALFAVVFALAIPIRLFMNMDGWDWENAQQLLGDSMQTRTILLLMDDMLHMAVIASAVFAGIYQFYYLHSAKQIDFYYSFPIKKQQYYMSKSVISYGYFFLSYTVMTLLGMLVLNGFGMCTGLSVKYMAITYLIDQLSFLLVYFTTAIAMMLTGRLVVGICGSAVLLGMGLLLFRIVRGYQEIFFTTYILNGQRLFASYLQYLSPPYLGCGLRNAFSLGYVEESSVSLFVGVVLLLAAAGIVGLFFLGRLLILRRPAEAAGQSMAFPWPARIIHMVLTVVGSLMAGLLIRTMAYSKYRFWLMLGIVCSAILIYGIIQFIYTLDIRKTLQYKWQLPVAMACSILVAAVFAWDLTGYDSYLPKEDDLAYVSVKDENVNATSSYNVYYNGFTVDTGDYYLNHIKMACDSQIYEFLQSLVSGHMDWNENKKNVEYTHNLTVRYTLENGRQADRRYTFDLDALRAEYEKILDHEEFRASVYPVMGDFVRDENIYQLNLNYAGEMNQIFNKNDPKRLEFLDVYKKEFAKIQGKQLVEEVPLASIIYWYGEEESSNEGYLPIYESSTETLAYLRDIGIDIKPVFTVENISEIIIYDYRNAEASEDGDLKEIVLTDKGDIEEMIPYLLDYDMNSSWQKIAYAVSAEVTYQGVNGYQIKRSCGLKSGVPTK